jgi:hypothetical protein
MIPIVAAEVAKKVATPETTTQIINVTKSATKWSLIITGVVIGGVFLYIGGKAAVLNIARNKAQKLDEAVNAANIYTIIESRLPSKSWLRWLLSPLVFETTVNLPNNLKNLIWGESEEKDAYNLINELSIQNVAEVQSAYHGLYNRNLTEDLESTIGNEYAAKIKSKWKITDINNTGYTNYGNTFNVKDGKQIDKYTPGHYAAYEDKYALVVKDGKGKLVQSSGTVVRLLDMNFKKGNYAGQAKGFKILNISYSGGLIFKDSSSNIVGIYLVVYKNGQMIPVIAPVDCVLLFDNMNDLNDYAYAKKISVTAMNV